MVELINLTPHEVVLLDENNEPILTLPPAEKPARSIVKNKKEGELRVVSGGGVKGIKLNSSEVEGVTENLPEPRKGVYYVVSFLVCRANPERDDLLIVDELVRDESGKVIGARALSRNPFYSAIQEKMETVVDVFKTIKGAIKEQREAILDAAKRGNLKLVGIEVDEIYSRIFHKFFKIKDDK